MDKKQQTRQGQLHAARSPVDCAHAYAHTLAMTTCYDRQTTTRHEAAVPAHAGTSSVRQPRLQQKLNSCWHLLQALPAVIQLV